MFRKIEKHEISQMSDSKIQNEIDYNMTLIDDCNKVEKDCDITEEEGWLITIIRRLLRQEYNLLKYEQHYRKKK